MNGRHTGSGCRDVLIGGAGTLRMVGTGLTNVGTAPDTWSPGTTVYGASSLHYFQTGTVVTSPGMPQAYYSEIVDRSLATPEAGHDLVLTEAGLGHSYLIGSDHRDAMVDGVNIGDWPTVLYSGSIGDNDVLYGQGGDDVLQAHGGDDRVYGGDGNDLIIDTPILSAAYAITDWADRTWLNTPGHTNNDQLYGGAGNDQIVAGGGNALLDGGDGNDILRGGGNSDVLYGGAGNDTLVGDDAAHEDTAGDDYLNGEDGDDLLWGEAGADTLIGGAGADRLHGDGATTTGANQDNDYLDGGDGNDLMWGDDELSGDSTTLSNGSLAADGFAALAEMDSNADGVVNSADAQFNNLRVWRDLNQDGISQSNELSTLTAADVASITVAHTDVTQNLSNGNTITAVGTFTRTDGSTATVGGTNLGDANLVEDTFHREFTDTIPLAEGVSDLPNMQGSGRVRDLWEAASLSTGLQSLLASYDAAATRTDQLSQIDALLLSWANTAGMQSLEERASSANYHIYWHGIGAAINPNSLAMHAGNTYGVGSGGGSVQTPEEAAAQQAWLATYNQAQAMFAVLEAFNGKYFFALPTDTFGGARTGASLKSYTVQNGGSGGGSLNTQWMQIDLNATQLSQLTASYEALKESVYNALLLQTRFEPLLDMIVLQVNAAGTGLELDFTDVKADLQDRIAANAINGVADLLDFNLVTKSQLAGTNWDGWMMFGQAINAVSSTSELAEMFAGSSVVKFANPSGGTVVGPASDIILVGSLAGDSLKGSAGNDRLYGLAGNDTLNGYTGNDTLEGGDGDDVLTSSGGYDVMRGGAGNDTITGVGTFEGGTGDDVLTGSGNYGDTYQYQLGDGRDTITNNSYTYYGLDTLAFGAGITPSMVSLLRSGNDMVLRISETDQITVKNWFTSSAYYIDRMTFQDGTVWTVGALQGIALPLITGTAAGETINGWNGIDAIDGGDGNDTINGQAGNDILFGGAGNDSITDTVGKALFNGGVGTDTITGGSSNELFIGGTGNDAINTSTGADIIAFNKGDGQDTVAASTTKDNTLSIGGGATYADLLFQKNGNNLVLKIGAADQITFANYYASTSNRSVNTLQMILEGSSDYAPAAGDSLRDNKIETFNFDGLVSAFDAALVANPSLTSWALTNALTAQYLSGSDTAATGGDLTYRYGLTGNLADISSIPAAGILTSSSFGTAAQTLQSLVSLQDSSPRLS